MNNTILEIKNLSKKSGSSYRVKNLSMSIPKSCVYGFLGPNGAGKTTTLKMILGLIKKDAGEIKLFGEDVSAKNLLSLLHKTGSLIENPGGYPHLSGLENMQIIAKLKDVNESEIEKALKTVRLYEQKDKKLGAYSLGMKQRLGIAMALLGDPKFLILDEPSNGLDPAGIMEIRNLITSLPKERDITVLISSQLLKEIEQVADDVGISHTGRMLARGKLSELESTGENLEQIFLELTGERESL